MTRTTIRKYLEFLQDDSERLIAQHNLDKYELDTLKREFVKFLDEVTLTKGVDTQFIAKLNEINLNPRKNSRRTGFDSFIRILSWIRLGDLLLAFAGEQVRTKDIRDTITEFRDRISQLAFGFNAYKLPK
jgi:cytoskeletal protein RodZ